MLTQSGLYYPYIHFRSDDWLKRSALYWEKMGRMVPDDYVTRDSRTVKTLSDQIDYVEDIDPGAAVGRTATTFLRLLAVHGAQIREHLGPINQSESPRRNPSRDGIGYIYAEKMTEPLVEALEGLELAYPMTDQQPARYVMRKSLAFGRWIAMDERLAAVYMTVLAEEISRTQALSVVTDQRHAQIGMRSSTVAGLADALLGEGLSLSVGPSQVEVGQRVAYLAIEMAAPVSMAQISAQDVVRFRTHHSDSLHGFQAAVAMAAGQLSSVPGDLDQKRFEDLLIDLVARELDGPRRDLAAALRSNFKDALLGTTVLEAGITATISQLPTDQVSLIGSAVGLAAGVATIARRAASQETAMRRQQPAAEYLLELESTLRPDSSIRRALRRVAKH